MSAVDSHTAQWIFDNCITGELMANRTCILVTHNTGLCLASAEHVVVMSNGRVVNQGSGKQISEAVQISKNAFQDGNSTNMQVRNKSPNHDMTTNQPNDEVNTFSDQPDCASNEDTTNKMNEEQKADGKVSWRVYRTYLRAFGGTWFWLILIFAFILQQVSNVSTSWWIEQWVSRGAQEESAKQSSGNHLAYFLFIYSVLGLGYAIITALCQFIFFSGSLHASRKLYEALASNVVGSKLRFFDITPLGRIINRFSRDIQSIDQQLARYGIMFLQNVLRSLSIVVLITVITPHFLFVGIIVVGLFIAMDGYLCAVQESLGVLIQLRDPLFSVILMNHLPAQLQFVLMATSPGLSTRIFVKSIQTIVPTITITLAVDGLQFGRTQSVLYSPLQLPCSPS